MKLFRRKRGNRSLAQEQPVQQVAPGTQIHYDPALVGRFKNHHEALVDLIKTIRQCAGAGNYADTAKYVHRFKLLLNQHLLEENLRLYTYLSHCLQDDPEGVELMRDMRQEMGGIGRKVARFIRHYAEFGIDEGNVKKFIGELDALTTALADRIQREEDSLYTLYLPPDAIGAGSQRTH